MGRPRREDARDTRALILQVTVELLADRGVSGMAVSDIAERLGVTKAAVFYHFPTRNRFSKRSFRHLSNGLTRSWTKTRLPGARRKALFAASLTP